MWITPVVRFTLCLKYETCKTRTTFEHGHMTTTRTMSCYGNGPTVTVASPSSIWSCQTCSVLSQQVWRDHMYHTRENTPSHTHTHTHTRIYQIEQGWTGTSCSCQQRFRSGTFFVTDLNVPHTHTHYLAAAVNNDSDLEHYLLQTYMYNTYKITCSCQQRFRPGTLFATDLNVQHVHNYLQLSTKI